MAEVDDRIVAMKFDNRSFESKIQSTIKSLDDLKKSLDFTNSAKGFQELSAASDKFNLNGIANSVDAIAQKFSSLGIIGVTALANIANRAVDAGIQLGKSLSLDQVLGGFQEYETNINSIQTILANTGSKGTTLEDVNSALDQLNTYSDKTIYNFAEMARNIGTFTAAGVDLDTAVGSIKGIANLAALSGSSAQQAAGAMYQLSQAIATGTVRLIDWTSVSTAGIGGEVFQKALFETGKALGTINGITLDTTFEEWKKANGSFRDSLSGSGKEIVDTNTAIVKAQQDAAKIIGDAEKEVADTTENANQRVLDAKQRVKDAATDGADAVASASERQRRTIEDDANSIKQAWQDVIDARKRLDRAMQPASADDIQAAQDRLTSSQLDQADLTDAITRAEQQQTRALDRETKARQKLAAAQASGDLNAQNAAYFELQDATNAVADAADAVTRAQLQQRAAARDVTSAQENLNEVQKKGTDQDQNVIDAKDALESAETRYAREVEDSAKRQKEAAKDVAQAKEDAVRRQEDAIKNLADVEDDRVKAIERVQDRLAKAHEDAAKRIQESGGAVENSWLTSDVLTTTLQAFTGDLDKAGLMALGYTEEQAVELEKLGKLGQSSAADVKTLSQLLDTVKQSVGSGWAESFRSIFGTFEEAKLTFTAWNEQIGAVVKTTSDARNKIISDWAAMGGRAALIEGITNVFKDLVAFLKPIKEAFREIFPRKTGAELAGLTKGFLELTKRLKISSETADTIKRVFKGVFAAFSIVGIVVKNVVKFFGGLLKVFTGVAGSPIVSVVGAIADGLVAINQKLKEGKGLEAFFGFLIAGAQKLGSVFKGIITIVISTFKAIGSGALTVGEAIGSAVAKIGAFLSSIGGGVFTKIGALFSKAASGARNLEGVVAGSALGGGMKYLSKVGERLSDVWHGLLKILEKLKDGFVAFGKILGRAFGGIWDAIQKTFTNAKFSDVLDVVNVGLLGGLVLLFKKFADGGLIKTIFGKDFVQIFKDIFNGVTNTLSALQAQIKAGTLIKIAGAIALLAGSIILISLIDSKKLTFSLGAISAGLAGLVGALAALDKIGGADPKSVARLAGLATVMIIIGGAIFILSAAIALLSVLNPAEIATGLGAIAGIITALVLALGKISAFKGTATLKTSLAIIAIATAIGKMAKVVRILGAMDPAALVRGLGGVSALIGGLILAFDRLPTGSDNKIKGMVKFSIGLRIMVSSVKALGGMDVKSLAQGLAALGGIVAGIVVFFKAMQDLNPAALSGLGTAMIGLGIGLVALGIALAIIGNLELETLAKGIGTIAIVLTGMAFALDALSTGLTGAGVIVAVSAAFVILAAALAKFHDIGIGDILKGLGAMVGVMLIIGLAAAALAAFPPLIPALYALGGALLLVGAGFALIGFGAAQFAKAFATVAKFGKDGVKIFKELLKAVVDIIPSFIGGLADGILQLGGTLIEMAPQLVEGLINLIIQLLQGFREILPELGKTVGELIDTLLKLLTEKGPDIIQAGLTFLLNFLKGISDNIAQITDAVVDIIVGFLGALSERAEDIIAAGLGLLKNLAKGISDNVQTLVDIAGDLIGALIRGMTGAITGLGQDVVDLIKAIGGAIVGAANEIGTQASNIIKAILGAMATAVTNSATAVNDLIKAIVDALISTTNTLSTEVPRLVVAIFDAMVNATTEILDGVGDFIVAMCNKFSEAIKKHAPEIAKAGGKLSAAIVQATTDSPIDASKGFFGSMGGWLLGQVDDLPFVEIGKDVTNGAVKGLEDPNNKKTLENSGKGFWGTWVNAFTKAAGIKSPSRVMMGLAGYLSSGLAKGLLNESGNVSATADKFAGTFFTSLTESLGNITDINPTISPVLDLTQVEKEASRLGGILGTAPVVGSVSSTQAAALSAAEKARLLDSVSAAPTAGPKDVTFTQIINSPRELSTAAIYRQTKSQIALATEELTK